MGTVQVRRIYDDPDPTDGQRVLVDRLWARGISKERAALGEWCKDVAPSTELRTWYGHDPAKFDEFKKRYTAELKDPDHADALDHRGAMAKKGTLTLLTASKRDDISEATCSPTCSTVRASSRPGSEVLPHDHGDAVRTTLPAPRVGEADLLEHPDRGPVPVPDGGQETPMAQRACPVDHCSRCLGRVAVTPVAGEQFVRELPLAGSGRPLSTRPP